MSSTVHLSKHHGLGNDFLVALSERNAHLVPDASVARAWCHRHRGVGADGLIWCLPTPRDGIDGRMILHNSDGSEAEISGNGIRCLAQAIAMDRGAAELTLIVETAAGDRRLRVAPAEGLGVSWADAEMGTVTTGPAAPELRTLGVPGARAVATGDVGNPHLVIWADDAWSLDPAVHGPRIEAAFPAGINVHLIDVAPNGAVRMRIWERGAGVTDACGSGATVVAHWARVWGLVAGDVVHIEMPGGIATLSVYDSGRITLGSEVVHVADVEIAEE